MGKSFIIALFGAALLLAPATAHAQGRTGGDRHSQVLPLAPDGTLRVDNAQGDVIVTGADVAAVTLVVDRIVRGVDDEAVTEGRRSSKLNIRSDGKNMILQSLVGFHSPARWNVTMNYTLRVPRSARVQINSGIAERIHLRDLSGGLLLKNNGGQITIINPDGPMNIETSNGNLRVLYAQKPRHNSRLVSVNGQLEVSLPRESVFEWVAETLRGNLFSSLDLRGAFDRTRSGKYFRAEVNGGNGPRLETFTVTGPIFLLGNGANRQQAAVLHPEAPARPVAVDQQLFTAVAMNLLRPPTARSFVFQRSVASGNVSFNTSMGNIIVGEVRGDAQLITRGGEIILGRAGGSAEMKTTGGSINVGDVAGPVDANTEAGDVSVRSTTRGGTISTGGGDVLVGFAGGDISMTSGGGDITVRRASGAVTASTRSGNVTIAVDSAIRTQRIDAKTIGGNILLSIPAGFGADIDATIFTLDPNAHAIESDLPGLTITTDRAAGGKTRIRAVGKINGGGERVELRTDEGDIHIRSRGLVSRK